MFEIELFICIKMDLALMYYKTKPIQNFQGMSNIVVLEIFCYFKMSTNASIGQ